MIFFILSSSGSFVSLVFCCIVLCLKITIYVERKYTEVQKRPVFIWSGFAIN